MSYELNAIKRLEFELERQLIINSQFLERIEKLENKLFQIRLKDCKTIDELRNLLEK